MKFNRLVYLASVVAVLMAISIAFADIPPPPVDQNVGLPDTAFGEFTEPECRECHSSGLVDRHHLLIDEGYTCTQCHNINDQGLEFTRDCVVCHASSPHHVTQAAIDRICTECHGSIIDDYNDGHDIPTYNTSLVTPDTSFTYQSGTLKIGGCEACHEAGGENIHTNAATHHGTGLGCDLCHSGAAGTLDIRKCEDCHGVRSLHIIQYDYDNTVGKDGYGHIGSDWDCWGCHGWDDMSSSAQAQNTVLSALSITSMGDSPGGDLIVPTASEITNPVEVGKTATITGIDFTSTQGDESPVVTVLVGDVEITPTTISDNEITFEVTSSTGNLDIYVKKNLGDDSVLSNKLVLSVIEPSQDAVILIRN